jgi:hypothetical protein
LLFYAESPDTPWPANAAEYTAFSAAYDTAQGIDLTKGKLARDKAQWTHVTDYAACQSLADSARVAGIDVIRYQSVRDPRRGFNVALLKCSTFARPRPMDQQTWHIRLSATGAQAICEAPKTGMTFDRNTFASDPRIAKLDWRRERH